MTADTWSARYSFADILGDSRAMRDAIRLARTASEGGYPTLIVGETGTGKELFAQAIHNASARRAGPFVAINCGTLSGEVALAELCGHEPGAFTGADRHTRSGLFDAARGGTLFLDELQDIPALAQSVLLRFLETGTFVRIGGMRPVHSGVRVLAALNVAVEDVEQRGVVRSDLLYRLNCLVIELAPLRERREDIRAIGERCLRADLAFRGGADDDFWTALGTCPYAWPGNTRGLRNVLLKAVINSAPRQHLSVGDLPPYLWQAGRGAAVAPTDAGDAGSSEQQALRAVLHSTHHNVSEAARRIGVHRSTVYRRLSRSAR